MPAAIDDVTGLDGTARVAARVAARLARPRPPGSGAHVVTLAGPLGAGKTTFVRALVEALGGDPRTVTSPSFSLVNVYRARRTVYHVDLYRVASQTELDGLDLEDLLADPAGVVAVEWPALLAGRVGPGVLHVTIDFGPGSPTCRRIKVEVTPGAAGGDDDQDPPREATP